MLVFLACPDLGGVRVELSLMGVSFLRTDFNGSSPISSVNTLFSGV